MLQFKMVNRKPDQKLIVHRHEFVPQTGLGRRLLDSEHPAATAHYMKWNFYEKRGQWEAVCECKDIIFYSPATVEDEPYRKGHSWSF